ncbi:MAG: DeoR family transcriptional regulator [Cellulosilyticaceae bacterium]
MDTRQNKIIEILRIKKNVSIDYLCQSLSYSTSTIRRDVITLQEMGLVKREKGNVRLLVTSSKEKHFKIRAKENIDKKRVICGLAKDFITDGMSIFLDASSTVLQLVPILAEYSPCLDTNTRYRNFYVWRICKRGIKCNSWRTGYRLY